jgi:hypothetical protein
VFTACGTLVPPHPGHQQAASSAHYTTSCKHSLVLLRIGRNYRPKHVELIEIINKIIIIIIIIASSWLFLLQFTFLSIRSYSSFLKFYVE